MKQILTGTGRGPQYPYHPLINPSGHKQTNNLSNEFELIKPKPKPKPKQASSNKNDKDLMDLEEVLYGMYSNQEEENLNNLNNNNMYYPNFRSKMDNNPSYLPNFMQMGGEPMPEEQMMQEQQMQQQGDPQQMAQQVVEMFQQLPPELQEAVMQALMGDGGGQPQQKMGGYNNPGFRNLPQNVQDKIKRNS